MSIISMVLILSCCNSDDPFLNHHNDNHSQQKDSRYVSMDEAVEIANNFISQLDDSNTKSSSRKASSIEMLKGNLTKGDSEEEEYNDYYLINYENNSGFAIVSTDKYKIPVYAFSDEGSLSWSDTTYNEGFKQYVRYLEEPNYTFIPDSLIIKPNPGDLNDYKVNIYKEVSPLLTKAVAHIDQGAPFNMYCPKNNGLSTLAGCVPVAVSSILSYYSDQLRINGYDVNWYEIKNTEKSYHTALLLYNIGTPNYLNALYELTGTICKLQDIVKTFTLLKYTYTYHHGYDEQAILSSLRNKKPILFLGSRLNNIGITYGHAWVADGYLKTETIYSPSSIKPTYVYAYYLHILWGMGGKGNGYFMYNNGFGRTADYYEDGETEYSVNFYNHDIQTIHDITSQN